MLNDGNVIRDGYGTQARPEQGLSSFELSENHASSRAPLGILIFSRARQLLHINSRALELTGQLHQAGIGPVNDVHSAPMRELSAQILEMLDCRGEANIWEIFELKRVIFESERKILVRGFGLSDRNARDNSRLVIVLEEVGLRQGHQTQQAQVFSSANLCAVP